MRESNLVLDVGNTSVSAGVYNSGKIENISSSNTILESSSEREEFLRGVVAEERPDCAIVSSVVPEVTPDWVATLHEIGLDLVYQITHSLDLGIPIACECPASVGADRLVNAAAAAHLYGTPVVVCDFGTALTFDVLTKEEGYIGGLICPGLPLMFDYLAERTALLPHMRPAKATRIIGRNTRDAMQSGARLGYRGMVREILKELHTELAGGFAVCATGGFASWVLEDLNDSMFNVTIDPELTLKGIGRVGELNF